MSFEELFDAITDGPQIWKWRHYLPIYEKHFAKFRDTDMALLEVGVAAGGSLKLWRDYFGERARIYGVDIDPECAKHEGPNTRIFVGDQGDPDFWGQILDQTGPLDIVIDDGGHHVEGQLATLKFALRSLNPGGVYLCEDIYEQENAFLPYLVKLCRKLNERCFTGNDDIQLGPGQVLPIEHLLDANGCQRDIESISFYPFAAVIEMRSEPLLEQLMAPRHGGLS